jgi:hypothetical protein
VTIKVVSIPDTGSAIYRSETVSVPRDGAWHAFTFDPAAAGKAHSSVKLSVLSKTAFDADTAELTSPYGGP